MVYLIVVIVELHNQNWKRDGGLYSTTALLKVGSTTEHYSGQCSIWFRILSRLAILQLLWAICSTVLPLSQYIKMEFLIFQFMPIASSPYTGYQWEESNSIFKPFCSIFIHTDRISLRILFSRLSSHSCLSFSLCQVAQALIIFLAFCCTCSSAPISFCYQGAQN